MGRGERGLACGETVRGSSNPTPLSHFPPRTGSLPSQPVTPSLWLTEGAPTCLAALQAHPHLSLLFGILFSSLHFLSDFP